MFEGFARGHYYLGKFGNGSKTKYIANLLVAIHNVAAAEALVLAKKCGLDPAVTLRVVADGAGGSRMLQVRGPMIVKDDYSDAMIKIDVWQKDMKIIGEFARDLDCPTPLFAASAPFYTAAIASGHAKDDTAAVGAVLGEMAGLAPKRRGGRRAGRGRPGRRPASVRRDAGVLDDLGVARLLGADELAEELGRARHRLDAELARTAP